MSDLAARMTFQIDGEDREVFMSFGLLNRIVTLVESIERVPMIAFDTGLRNQVLTLALSTRSGKKVDKAFDPDETESDPEQVEAALNWVQEHVASFFAKQLRKQVAMMKDIGAANQEMEELLELSETG